MNAGEEWRPWRNGDYEVSNAGRVRRARPGKRTYVGRILRSFVAKNGYLQVCPVIMGKNRATYVHAMVAECFLGRAPDGMEVNHIDGNKTNAFLSNLEYVSHRGNGQHASRAGLLMSGERHSACKLSDEQVEELRRARRERGESYQSLASAYGVAVSHVFNICLNRTRRAS